MKRLAALVFLFLGLEGPGQETRCTATVSGIFDFRSPAAVEYCNSFAESFSRWPARGDMLCNASFRLRGRYNGSERMYYVSVSLVGLRRSEPIYRGAKFAPDDAKLAGCQTARQVAARLSLRREIRVDTPETEASALEHAIKRVEKEISCQ